MELYNTLNRKKEEFEPLEKGKVGMYVCGPTVYDESHVGHARTYIFFDFLRRFLEFRGYDVKMVINLTDVDDKIIARAKELGGWQVVADTYSRYFFRMMRALRAKPPHVYSTVTAHIQEIIELVETLMDKGYAYELDDGIYFDVAEFPKYGKLSGVDPDKGEAQQEKKEGKHSPADFALWKFRKPGEPYWHAPFGEGRPGWHIECSAMSSRYLGEEFDIHGGGADLKFPHHENEIAQSEAAFGTEPWVNYWVHVAFITTREEKMSKSLNNFTGMEKVLDSFRPEVVRYYLLSAHYRTQLEFSWDKLEKAREQWDRVARAWLDVLQRQERGIYGGDDVKGEIETEFKKAIEALEDDLATPEAYAKINFLAGLVLSNDPDKKSVKAAYEAFQQLDDVFAFLPPKSWTNKELSLAEELARLRERLRKREEFGLSDEIRSRLAEEGIRIEDTKKGPRVKFEA